MDWCFGQYGDCEAGYSNGVEDNGCVVQVSEERNAEAVDKRMRDQQSGIDANRLPCRRRIAGAYGCSCGDEARATECDARRNGDLPEQIEPAGDPRVKGRLVVRG